MRTLIVYAVLVQI